jgi:hemoglobin-like flavoprotein
VLALVERSAPSLMAPDQIAPLRASFDKLWPVNQRFAETFYARLFELKPKARSLFSADLAAQKAKLTGMLATIVGAVDKPEMFGSIVENLGKRHALFGVAEEHYPAVGEALMWSLEKTLGPSLTPDAREAWRELYEVVQLSMRGATDRKRGLTPALE